MIAVQTNERLDIIDMTSSEFLANVSEDGLNSSMIRAKVAMSINKNEWMYLAEQAVDKIQICFRQVGKDFQINFNPVNSTKDLEFYISPEGEQYSCENAYLFKKQKEEVTQYQKQESTVAESQTGISTSSNNQEDLGKPQDSAQTSEEPSTKFEDTSEKPKPEKPEAGENVIVVSEQQQKAASSLDNVVRSLPNISSASSYGLEGVKNYIGEQQDDFRFYAEQYLKETGLFHTDREHLKTDFKVSTALGETQDMLDALLVFPVYTFIIRKKESSSSRFKSSSLLNGTFLRVCPVSIMDGKVQSYVEEIIIQSNDIAEAKEIVNSKLKNEKISKGDLSAPEMYAYMEEALEAVYQRKRGHESAIYRSSLVQDMKSYLADFKTEFDNMVIPDIAEWNSYDTMAFDAREERGHHPITLSRQLQELNGKSIAALNTSSHDEEKSEEISFQKEVEEAVSETVDDVLTPDDDALEELFTNFETNAGYFDEATGDIVLEEAQHTQDMGDMGNSSKQPNIAAFFKADCTDDGGYVRVEDGKYVDSEGKEWATKDAYYIYCLLSDLGCLENEESVVKKRK